VAVPTKTTAVMNNGGTSMLADASSQGLLLYNEQVILPMEALQWKLHQ
jgi:hypothetical protein